MRAWGLILLLLGADPLAGSAAASKPQHDDTTSVATAPVGLTAQPWYRPRHAVLQTAGGQGMVTGGVGYTTLRGRMDIDVLGGYVPKKYSITPMGVFTAKATYSPWTLSLGSRSQWQVRPLSAGMLVSYSASKGINSSRDDKYYKGYYWWSSHTRVGGFVGGRAGRVIGTNRYGQPRLASFYYELGTNDLYLTSIMNNLGGLGVKDILTLGLGVKVDL